jgi:pimeloyl-ACP methyl ester carboxylesterase
MPYADNDGVSLYYDVGEEDDDAEATDEPVVLLADAGYGAWQWSWQYSALAGPFEVVILTTRGTGRSDAADSYSVEAMAADLEAVLADLGARKAHLVGAGMGGMVALRYPLDFSRAETLSLLGTSPGGPRAESVPPEVRDRLLADPADSDPSDPEALRDSLEPVASDDLLETEDLVERIVAWRREEDASREVQEAHFEAMAQFDASDKLYEITLPSLVLHGTDDRVVPVENGRLLADGLPKGEFREFPGEHLFFVDHSKAVNDALVGFLEEHTKE